MELPKRWDNKTSSGFSLIELLIVISVLTLLAGIGLFFGIDFYKSYVLFSEKNILVSIIETARAQSLVNLNETKHGVYLGGSDYLIFQGVNYSSRNPAYDQIVKASPTVSHSGLQEIVFDQLNGDPSATGTITLINSNKSVDIFIQNEGRISW